MADKLKKLLAPTRPPFVLQYMMFTYILGEGSSQDKKRAPGGGQSIMANSRGQLGELNEMQGRPHGGLIEFTPQN